jgi:hypothetical protein
MHKRSFFKRLQLHVGGLVRVQSNWMCHDDQHLYGKVGLLLSVERTMPAPSENGAQVELLIDERVECYSFFAEELELIGADDA